MSPAAAPEIQVYSEDDVFRMSSFYKPWPHQHAFHEDPAKYRLEVGGFGSGKSKPLLMEAVYHAMEYPGSNSIILRKTIPDLKRTVIDKFKKDVPKSLYEFNDQELGTYNETDHIAYWEPRMVLNPETGKLEKKQSLIFFSACEKDTDISKYLSTEFVFVGFEELGEFPFYIWDAFAGRNRCAIPGSRSCMAAATNPMGIGWGWIKRLWVDKLPAYGMDPEKYDPTQYAYFHSTVEDNPIYKEDKEYIDQLKRSPLRDRIYYGKLDAISGQYFENFDPQRHVRTRNDFLFEPWQPVWIGWDYGFGHPACITFWTKAVLKPRFEGEKPRLVNITMFEIVLNVDDSDKSTVEEQAHALIGAIPTVVNEDGDFVGYQWDVDAIYFSWERFIDSTKNKRGDVTSLADQAGEILAAAGLPRPSRSSTDRVAGWSKMYSMLDADEWFIIGEDCPTLCEALPLLVRGNGITCSLEDVVKPKGVSLYDDVGDAARYAVAGFLLEPGEKPREELLKEKLAGIKDPLARHTVAYKEWIKVQNEGKKPPNQYVPAWVEKARRLTGR